MDAPYQTYASAELVEPFFLAAAPGGQMAMLVGYGATTSLSVHVNPLASGGSPTFTPPGVAPVFLAANGASWLVGTMGAGGRLNVSRLQEKGGTMEIETYLLACSSAGVSADAVAYEDGFVLMATNGVDSPLGGCVDPETAGLPHRIDVHWIQPGAPPDLLSAIGSDIPVDSVVGAPHPDGAWVLHQTIQGDDRPIMVSRYDLKGNTTISAYQLSERRRKSGVGEAGEDPMSRHGSRPVNGPAAARLGPIRAGP